MKTYTYRRKSLPLIEEELDQILKTPFSSSAEALLFSYMREILRAVVENGNRLNDFIYEVSKIKEKTK